MTQNNNPVKHALRYIKEAYISGIIFGSFHAVFVIVATAEGDRGQFLRVIDSVFCYAMSYGIYRKSQVSAILLLLYCIGFIVIGFILPTSAVAFLVFVLAFVVARGVVGTFRYHKLRLADSTIPREQ